MVLPLLLKPFRATSVPFATSRNSALVNVEWVLLLRENSARTKKTIEHLMLSCTCGMCTEA